MNLEIPELRFAPSGMTYALNLMTLKHKYHLNKLMRGNYVP